MFIRFARQEDLPDILNIHDMLFRKSTTEHVDYTMKHLEDHFQTFPQGILVAEYEKRVVGYAMCFFLEYRWEDINNLSFVNSNTFIRDWHTAIGITAYGSSLAVLPEYRKYNFAHALFQQMTFFIARNYPSIHWVLAMCEDDNRSCNIHFKLGYKPIYVFNAMFNYDNGYKNGILMEILFADLYKAFISGLSKKWFGVRGQEPQFIEGTN